MERWLLLLVVAIVIAMVAPNCSRLPGPLGPLPFPVPIPNPFNPLPWPPRPAGLAGEVSTIAAVVPSPQRQAECAALAARWRQLAGDTRYTQTVELGTAVLAQTKEMLATSWSTWRQPAHQILDLIDARVDRSTPVEQFRQVLLEAASGMEDAARR